jgi:hypothetical protein
MATSTKPALKYIWMSPTHVSTTILQVATDPGMRGVLLVNIGTKDGIETYHSITKLEETYDIDTPIWDQANAYFKWCTDGQVQVLNVNQGGTLFANAATVPDIKTETDSGSATFTGTSTDGTAPSIADLVIDRLYKYYGAGFEYIIFNVKDGNEDVAIALSNFVEAQDKGFLMLNVVTPTSAHDFSKLAQIKENRATKIASLPKDLDTNSTFASEAIGKYVNKPIGSNFKFLTDFETVQPQDRYEFGFLDLAPYDAVNAATYGLQNDRFATTNGRSMSGISMGIMIYKDYLVNQIVKKVSDYLFQNDAPFDQATVNAIIAIIQGVLADGVATSHIEEYDVPPVDVSTISDEIKATGKLTGITWSYKPMRSIDEVWLAQTLEVTENE